MGGGSNVNRVIKEAGALGIDVHVIALGRPTRGGPSPATAESPRVVEVKTSAEDGSAPEPQDQ
jgi:hypothetical protein